MKWFYNLRIRWKLTIGFGIIEVFILVLAVMSFISIGDIDKNYSYLLDFPQHRLETLNKINEGFINMRRIGLATLAFSSDAELVTSYQTQFNNAYQGVLDSINKYIGLNDTDTVRDPAVLQANNESVKAIEAEITKYKTQVMDIAMGYILEGDVAEAANVHMGAVTFVNNASGIITELIGKAESFSDQKSNDATAEKNFVSGMLIILSAVVLVLSIAMTFIIGRILANPLRRLVDATDSLAGGNLNINKTEPTKDEIGQLMASVYKLVDIIRALMNEIDTMSREFEEGDIDAKINSSQFEGSYSAVAEGINKMAGGIIGDLLKFFACMDEFGNGNFSADIPRFPGKKEIMNTNLDTLRGNLKSVAGDIGALVRDASEGMLSSRVDTKNYKGDWAELLNSMNRLMETIATPISEAAEVLHHVAAGDFSQKVTGNYKGEFLTVKNSINETVTNVAGYIGEISSVLGAVSNDNDLNQEITREYVGDFSEIKFALNNILDKFNSVISEVFSASDQVAAGARQISESSMTLAQGASEQAASVEELNATIITIKENTDRNANNAREAEVLAVTSKSNAQNGDHDMRNMLTSIEGINDSSKNIASIIKVIDDIAFQTNLLALNAAVEAARAGEHGKGFAVVAGEVRNLAGKSQTSSGEIAALIDESIKRVSEGSATAGMTAKALNTIVDDTERVSDIISRIAAASQQQSEAIGQVTLGLSQITEVVQNNSATSEEAASASQQLSSQAEVLRNLVSVFKLKGSGYQF